MQTLEEPPVSGSVETLAAGAGLGSVLSGNFDYFDSLPFSLVGYELLELEEASVVQPAVESPAFALFSDPSQPFHHDCVARCKSSDYLLGNFMVDLCHKPFLLAAKLSEKPFGRASAFGLEFPLKIAELGFPLLNLAATEEPAVGSDSQFLYPDIDADNLSVATRMSADINIFGKCNVDKQPLLSVKDEVGGADLPRQIVPEASWNFNRYLEPAFNRTKRNHLWLEAEASRIISDCHEFPADGLSAIELACLKHIASRVPAAANELCRKLAVLSDRIIGNIMEFSFIKVLQFPSPIKNRLDCFRVLLHGFKKLLPDRKLQLDSGNGFHDRYLDCRFKYLTGVKWRFLSALKCGVSSPRFL